MTNATTPWLGLAKPDVRLQVTTIVGRADGPTDSTRSRYTDP